MIEFYHTGNSNNDNELTIMFFFSFFFKFLLYYFEKWLISFQTGFEKSSFSSAENLYTKFQAKVNFLSVLSDLVSLKSVWKGSCWFQSS